MSPPALPPPERNPVAGKVAKGPSSNGYCCKLERSKLMDKLLLTL